MTDGSQIPVIHSMVLAPDFEELGRARRYVGQMATADGFPEDRVFEIMVACSEAVANAIEHAPIKGEVTLKTLQYRDRLEVQVLGPGEFQAPHHLKTNRSHRGLGLPLMAQFSDHLALYSGPSGGTLVSLTFYCPGVEPVPEEPMPPSIQGLVEESEFVRAITSNAPVGLLVIDPDLRIRWTNPAYQAFLEEPFRSRDLTGMFLTDVVPGLAESGEPEKLREASQSGKPLGVAEHELSNPSWGVARWRRNAVPFTGASSGPPYDLLVVVTDETERYRAERALQESEHNLRTILDNSRDGINMLDLVTGRYVFMSSAQVEVTGFTLEEINGISADEAYERVHPADRAISMEQQRRVMAGEDLDEPVEYRWRVKSGEYRWFSDRRRLVRDEDGRPVALVGISRDITEQKRIENERRLEEQKYRDLYEFMDQGFAVIDVMFDKEGRAVDLCYVEANAAAKRAVGQDLTGKCLGEIAPGYPESWYETFGRVAVTGQSTRHRAYSAPDQKWYDYFLFKIGGPESRRIGTTFVDVTEEVHREENLRFVNAVDRLLSGGLLASEAVTQVGEMLGDHLGVDNFVFAEADEGGDKAGVLYAWHEQRAVELLRSNSLSELNGPDYWEAMHDGIPYVICDTDADGRTDGGRHREFGVGAFIIIPFDREGRWKYLLSVDSATPRNWTAAEVGLVKEVFTRVVARVERARAEEDLRANEESYRLLAEENERLYRQQLNIAEQLQQTLLHIPSEIGRVRLGHLYRSATEAARVGGDFYDVFEAKDGQIAILIGDVAGHGIQAARTGTLVKDVVHAFTHQSIRTHEVLRRTNQLLIEKDLPEFVTLFLAILDPGTGIMHYSSAGHPESMVKRVGGQIEMLGCGTSPLGIYPDASWKPREISLAPGDLLLLYTDGVTEARRGVEMFGEKRLERLLKRKRISPSRLPHMILDQVLAFSGGSLRDDAAVLVLSLTEPPEGEAPRPAAQQTLLDV